MDKLKVVLRAFDEIASEIDEQTLLEKFYSLAFLPFITIYLLAAILSDILNIKVN